MATATTGKTSEITIFLMGEGTLMFYDCELLDCDELCDFRFTYVSADTGKKKHATFCTNKIAGFSYAIEENGG